MSERLKVDARRWDEASIHKLIGSMKRQGFTPADLPDPALRARVQRVWDEYEELRKASRSTSRGE